jgi:hypothetical protein
VLEGILDLIGSLPGLARDLPACPSDVSRRFLVIRPVRSSDWGRAADVITRAPCFEPDPEPGPDLQA